MNESDKLLKRAEARAEAIRKWELGIDLDPLSRALWEIGYPECFDNVIAQGGDIEEVFNGQNKQITQ